MFPARTISRSAVTSRIHAKRVCVESVEATEDVTKCVLNYAPALVCASLLRRYQRFLGDVHFNEDDNDHTVIYVPNTGPMIGCLGNMPAAALVSVSSNAKRKHAHTLEWLQPGGVGTTWVGVHSAKANAMVRALLDAHMLPELGQYGEVRSEVKYGRDGGCRVDFVLERVIAHTESERKRHCYVEVKSVTLAEDLVDGGRIALFPDTVSTRAQRHVKELTSLVQRGHEAALIFVVQRSDCMAFGASWEHDAKYAALVEVGMAAGVQVIALEVELRPQENRVMFNRTLPIDMTHKKPND